MVENGFERLIQALPKDIRVLDVGGGGLHGENTTNALLKHFYADNVVCVCTATKEVNTFKAQLEERSQAKPTFIDFDFYNIDWNEQFGLVVLDLNIDNNLKDWSEDQLKKMHDLVAPGGMLINYVMMTDQYGDKETGERIREHSKKWWITDIPNPEAIGRRLARIKGWEPYLVEREARRPEIIWVMLKKV